LLARAWREGSDNPPARAGLDGAMLYFLPRTGRKVAPRCPVIYSGEKRMFAKNNETESSDLLYE
jgi:hypothetical protein